jgi:hypothetical protein
VRSRVLALLLAVLMTPAAAELIETAVHVVEHGDLGHLAVHGDAPLGGDEHGCSAVFHVCGCHTSSSLPSVSASRPTTPQAHHAATLLAYSQHYGLGNPPPPLRPPIV